MDVVDALANTPTTMGMDGSMSQPVTPVVMRKVIMKAMGKVSKLASALSQGCVWPSRHEGRDHSPWRVPPVKWRRL
jgi:hypothetical protein